MSKLIAVALCLLCVSVLLASLPVAAVERAAPAAPVAVRLTDINPGVGGADPRWLTEVDDQLFFAANNGQKEFVWAIRDTSSDAIALSEEGNISSETSWRVEFAELNGAAYFLSQASKSLWRSDGTAAGTTQLKQFVLPHGLTALGDALVFASRNDPGNSLLYTLWRSNGTAAGTTPVTALRADFSPPGWDPEPLPPYSFTRAGQLVFFGSFDAVTSTELWATDGTAQGTRRVADLVPGPTGSYPTNLMAVGSQLFFLTSDGVNQMLWRSDGSGAGTTKLGTFRNVVDPDNQFWRVALGNQLYFAADDGTHGRELWTSDGTAAGTRLAADINPGAGSSAPAGIASVGDTLFFAADDGARGRELWGYDGRPGSPYASAPPVVGGLAGQVVGVPVQIGNGAATDISGTLTLSATLGAETTYAGDTFGVAPRISDATLVWALPAPEARRRQTFTLLVTLPQAPRGTRFPLALSYSAPGPDGALATGSITIELMVAERIFLPVVRR